MPSIENVVKIRCRPDYEYEEFSTCTLYLSSGDPQSYSDIYEVSASQANTWFKKGGLNFIDFRDPVECTLDPVPGTSEFKMFCGAGSRGIPLKFGY